MSISTEGEIPWWLEFEELLGCHNKSSSLDCQTINYVIMVNTSRDRFRFSMGDILDFINGTNQQITTPAVNIWIRFVRREIQRRGLPNPRKHMKHRTTTRCRMCLGSHIAGIGLPGPLSKESRSSSPSMACLSSKSAMFLSFWGWSWGKLDGCEGSSQQ